MKRALLLLIVALGCSISSFALEPYLVTDPSEFYLLNADMQYIPGSYTHSGVLSLNPGWQFVQEFTPNPCSGVSCTTPATCASSNCLVPLTVGDVVVVALIGGNTSTTISGVTGSLSTVWANAGCQAFQTGVDNIDIEYTLSVATTAQQLTVNFAGTSLGSGYLDIMELRPPAGHAAIFDGCGHNTPTACTASCVGGAPTVTGTDVIVQEIDCTSVCPVAFNSWSSPYVATLESTGLCLNCSSGSAPTVAIGSSFSQNIVGIAFKTDAGAFTPPTPTFSINHYSTPALTGIPCSPTCNLTITSTGTGHLLFMSEVDSGGNNTISSVTGAGTWVATTGCHKNGATGSWEANCFHNLASTSGVTTLTVTMSGNVTTAYFAVWEIARTSGSFTLDTSGCTLNGGSATFMPTGQPLTLANNNPHVTFQLIAASGGVDGATFYPFPWVDGLPNGTVFNSNNASASNAILLNDTVGQTPIWPFPGATTGTSTAVCAASFL